MDETPEPKKYTVRCWDITLKSGQTASFSLREDLGDEWKPNFEGWMGFTVKREKRVATVRESEIAAVNYYEIEMAEPNTYKPKSVKKSLWEQRRDKKREAEITGRNTSREPDLS